MKFFNRIKHNTSLGYPRHTESQEDRAPRLFQGYLDSAADGNLSGWGWKAGDDNPVDVDILIDGRFAARLTAANYRDDLETAGIGSGNHGFVYSVFDAIHDGLEHEVRVIFAATGEDLQYSPQRVFPRELKTTQNELGYQPRPRLEHGIKGLYGNKIEGWIYDPGQPHEILEVCIVIKLANQPSEDLAIVRADQGNHFVTAPTGQKIPCGFSYRLPTQSAPAHVSVYERKSRTLIKGAPIFCGVSPRLEGRFERLSGGRLYGWAFGSQIDYKVVVDVYVDRKYAGTAYAVDYREDLHEALVGLGSHGFVFDVPPRFNDRQMHDVELLFHDTGTHLTGSPARLCFSGEVYSPVKAQIIVGGDALMRGVLTFPEPQNVEFVEVEVQLDGCTFAGVKALPQIAGQGTDAFEFAVRVPGVKSGLTVSLKGQETLFPVRMLTVDGSPSELSCEETNQREVNKRSKLRARKQTPHKVKFLVAMWGEAYINRFCEFCLPSLLSANNLPKLQEIHPDFEFVILTRREEIPLFRGFPAFARLSSRFRCRFIEIDDLVKTFFEPAPERIYPVALTHAFFRGIKDSGEDATSTDFIFWNADFLAADGAFTTLAKSLSEGNRCTIVPSLRLDFDSVGDFSTYLSADRAVLTAGSKELVRIALNHPHPTVVAKTITAHKNAAMASINQFYWRLSNDVLIARSFLMFMLHIRPEQVWNDIYGFCDYAFIPEMILDGPTKFICSSDEIFVAELQEHNKEAERIRREPMKMEEIARTIDYYATYDHVAASRNLLIFNAGPDLDTVQLGRTEEAIELARVMDDIYARIAKQRPWHNLHIYWRDSYRLIYPDSADGLEQEPPGPDHPRSETARIMRWTGYDLDILKDSWYKPPVNLTGLYHNAPALSNISQGKICRWLDDLFDTYVSAWRLGEQHLVDRTTFDLIHPSLGKHGHDIFYSVQFSGCRWGLVDRYDAAWWRLLGPGGGSLLLNRVTQRSSFCFIFNGRTFGTAVADELGIYVNDRVPASRADLVSGRNLTIKIFVSREQVIEAGGFLTFKLIDHQGPRQASFGFSSYTVDPYDDENWRRLILDDQIESQELNTLERAWPIQFPSLAHILEESKKPLPLGIVRFESEKGLMGIGWMPAFKCFGRFFRWISCKSEKLVVRLHPGKDHILKILVNRILSSSEIVFDCCLVINGCQLAKPEIQASSDGYIIISRISRDVVDAKSGWLCLEATFAFGEDTNGAGRIEYAEPFHGGLALESIVFQAIDPIECETIQSDSANGNQIGVAESFWRQHVAPVLPPVITVQQRACELAGVDYAHHRMLVVSYGGLASAAWNAVSPELAGNLAAVNSWLDFVNRAIARCWSTRLEPAKTEAFEIGFGDAPNAAGLGRLASAGGAVGRSFAPNRPVSVMVRIDLSKTWLFDIAVRTRTGRTQIGHFRVARLEASVKSDDSGDGVTNQAMIVEVSEPAAAADHTGAVLTGLAGRPESEPTAANFYHTIKCEKSSDRSATYLKVAIQWTDHQLMAFAAVAARHGLDPWLYICSAERSDTGSAIRNALEAFAEVEAANPSIEAVLLDYLDYTVASSPNTRICWDQESLQLNLLEEFDGVGWGMIATIKNQPVRLFCHAGHACVLVEIPRPGFISLEIEGVGDLVSSAGKPVTLNLNGIVVPTQIKSVDAHCWRLGAACEVGSNGMLTVGFSSAVDCTIGIRALTFIMTKVCAGENAALKIPLTETTTLTPPFFRFPQSLADLESASALVKIPKQDLLLWRFGRDASFYRALLKIYGEAPQAIYETVPPGDPMPSPRTQAWLDLLDETIVSAMLSKSSMPVKAIFPGLGRFSGLGWGTPLDTAEGTARTLSGSNDAILFIPPQAGAYRIDVRFASGSSRDSLLRVRASVNRRFPRSQTLSFDSEGPRLLVQVSAAETGLGDGWAALRLYLDDSKWSYSDVMSDPAHTEFKLRSGITYRQSPTTIEPHGDVAVLDVALSLLPACAGVRLPTSAKPAAELPMAIYCVVPVWGKAYTDTFLEMALPTHLVAGNLGALRNARLVYQIYTDDEGRAAIESHRLFPLLCKNVDQLEFHDIKRLRYEERTNHELTLNYSVMNKAHQRAIASAMAANGALLFTNCDTIYSDGVFARIWELCTTGFRAVENLSIRTDRDEMIAALNPRKANDGLLSLTSSRLTEIALDHLHWIAKGRFWKGPPGLTIPDNLYWQVSDSAIIARATHYMPLFVYPRSREVAYQGTIDHGFVPASGIAESECWRFVMDSEPSSYELSLSSHDQYFPPYERGSIRDFTRFIGLQCEASHLRNLETAVRIGATPVSEERWRSVIDESAAILDDVRRYLQHYSLTPWRPDRFTKAEGGKLNWQPEHDYFLDNSNLGFHVKPTPDFH